MIDDASRKLVCAAARQYLGAKWIGQARSKQAIDCTGLIVMSFRDAGFDVDEGVIDYRSLDGPRMMRVLMRHCERIPDDAEPKPADVVIYTLLGSAGHLALLLDRPGGGLNAIHSSSGGYVEEARFDPKRGVIKGIYRWRLSSSPSH